MTPLQIARTAVDVLAGLFEGRSEADPPARTLDDLTLDDLRREKVRLEVGERRRVTRLRELEGEKRQLFEAGVQNPSEREQRLAARKIKELEVESRNLDRNLEFMSRQLRIINGFLQLKDNQRLLAQSGIAGVLGGLDLQTLQLYVDRASVEGEFRLDKFSEILAALESASGAATPSHEDDEVMQIVRAMQQAREAAEAPQPLTDSPAWLTQRTDLTQRDGMGPAA
jgi:hypothetical protein